MQTVYIYTVEGLAVPNRGAQSFLTPLLQWLLDHEIDPLCLELSFSLDTDMFGTTEVIELRPGGNSISVTDANKVCRWREGFHYL